MKTISFALYLLVLACYPCTDEETCSDEKKYGIEAVDVTSHNHSSSESDHCSPFCICSCCATSVQLTVSTIVVPVNNPHNTSWRIPYQERSLPNSGQAIWQPPRTA